MFSQISLLEFFQDILVLRRAGASSGMFHVPLHALIQRGIVGQSMFRMPLGIWRAIKFPLLNLLFCLFGRWLTRGHRGSIPRSATCYGLAELGCVSVCRAGRLCPMSHTILPGSRNWSRLSCSSTHDHWIELEAGRLEALCYGVDRRRPFQSGWTSPNEPLLDNSTQRLRRRWDAPYTLSSPVQLVFYW